MRIFGGALGIAGLFFAVLGFLIYFRKKYHLINGFEADRKAGRRTDAYARKVGLIELIFGISLTAVGIGLLLIK